MPNKKNVDLWLERETNHKRKALENASRYFTRTDNLTVNTLEAIYGQESSFGTRRRRRGIDGPAGDFQISKATAQRFGLTVTKNNDQRFDVDFAATAAARYLKTLDKIFSKKTKLGVGLYLMPILNQGERIKFVLASYNAGEGIIAKAQQATLQAHQDPLNWNSVSALLSEVVANQEKIEEIVNYVENIIEYQSEFKDKSSADKNAKLDSDPKINALCSSGHWITKDDHHIFICD